MKLINDIYNSTVYVTKVVVPIFYLDSVREQKPKKTVYDLMVVKYVKQQFKHGLLTEVKLLGQQS